VPTSTPRWKVRRAVAGLLGDLTQFRATEDAPELALNIFKDARRLARDEMLLTNMDLVVVESTAVDNLYYRTRIANASRTDRTATVDPEFPDYIRGNDQIDGVFHRGTGWRLEEYDRVINEVITELDRSFAVETRADVSDGFDRYSPYLTIPENWVGVFDVEYQLSDESWLSTNEQFEIDQVDRTVIVPYNDLAGANGRVMRLWGYEMPAELVEDSDTTRCPLGYLKFMAAANLLLSGEARQIGDEVENKAMLYLQQGKEFMNQVATRIRPNVRWLD
jgi:hypothetical protein